MRRLRAAVVALGLLTAACSTATAGSGTQDHGHPVTVASSRYGNAPVPNPAVTYQPDVVIVGGGGASVRGVENGGLTWYLDPNASGARQLAVGKIMFVTGRSVGRVVDVHDAGGDRVVTIAPVQFTDVIKDGHFSGTKTVSLSSPLTNASGDVPFWAQGDAPSGGPTPQPSPSGTHSLAGAFAAAAAPTWPEPKLGGTSTVTAQGVNASASCCAGGAKISFSYDNSGVRFLGSATLTMAKPTALFDLKIDNGKVSYATLKLGGGFGLKVDIAAATSVFKNVDKLIPIPTDFTIPFANLLGVPLTVTINQLLGVTTHFSSKDGNISAHGEWAFSGGLGFTYANGDFSAEAPHSLIKKTSITDSLSGIATGVSSINLVYQTRVTAGIGAFGFAAGPYFGLTTLVTLVRGSALGSPIAVCNSAQVSIFADYGVGYSIPKPITKLINFFLAKFGSKPIEGRDTISRSIEPFSKIAYNPDSAFCRGK